MNIEAVKQSVEELNKAATKIDALLSEDPLHVDLKLKCNHTLRTLINGLSHMIGITPVIEAQPEVEVRAEVTHVFGIPINAAAKPIETAKPVSAEIEKLQSEINSFLNSINEKDTKEILKVLGKPEQLVIRGAAKVLGINDFKNRKINATYIEEIKTAWNKKLELDKKKEDEALRVKLEQLKVDIEAAPDDKKEDMQIEIDLICEQLGIDKKKEDEADDKKTIETPATKV